MSASTLGGWYELGAVLGQGATGTVYRARDLARDEDVAVKVLAPERVTNPAALARFLDEYRQLSNLSHPNLVPVYGSGREGDQVYIAMRLATDGTLRDRLDRIGGRLDPILVGRLVRQLAGALRHLHDHGLVHLDVKPANVLLVEPDWPLLGDFGVARVAAGEVAEAGPAGTPGYMSPEQCRNERVDGRADQYALGVLAYELLTGRRPFVADSVEDLMRAHALSPPPPPRALNPDLSPEVEAVLLRALAKAPEQRHESVDAFAEALCAALERLPRRRLLREDGAELERRLFLTRAAGSEDEARGRLAAAGPAARAWQAALLASVVALALALTGLVAALGRPLTTLVATAGPPASRLAGGLDGDAPDPLVGLAALLGLAALAALAARAAAASRRLGSPTTVAGAVAGLLFDRAPTAASATTSTAGASPARSAGASPTADETGDAHHRPHELATLTADRVRAGAAVASRREPDTAEMAALSGPAG